MCRSWMKRRFANVLVAAVTVALALSQPLVAAARTLSARDEGGSESPNPQEVEEFLDETLADLLPELDVPGLVFVMVREGEIVLSKGYGYADREQQIPFDPERTIVRAGSIIKTVTAVAMMQLAERGLIDLDADVNTYLTSFQVPDAYGQPITARQLLHYTGGLDSRFLGIRVETEEDLQPLRDYLAQHLPPRTRPPGSIRAYNDHEIALAGLLVEEVSGIPYERYVEENIFLPLRMTSTFMNLPEEEYERAAIGYGSTGPYPQSSYYLQDAPGAGFNTTASDLARYMIMHLQDGEYQGVRVLTAESAQELHRTGFRHHPKLPGIAYTFDEVYWGEVRILAKSGGAPGFQNRMLLFPDQDMGIYFVYNRDSTVPLRWSLENALLERFFPVGPPSDAKATISTSRAEVARFTGYYQDLTDYSDRGIEKVQQLMNQVQVTANPDGSLNLFGDRMVQVEPGLFRWEGSDNHAAFASDESGHVTYLYAFRTAFARIPWYETFPVQIGLLGFALVAFLAVTIGWFVSLLRRRGRQLWLAGLTSVTFIVFLVGSGILFAPLITSPDPPWQFSFAPPFELLALLALPLLGSGLSMALLVQTIRGWKSSRGGRLARMVNVLALTASLAFLFFLHTWNLLGYRL